MFIKVHILLGAALCLLAAPVPHELPPLQM